MLDNAENEPTAACLTSEDIERIKMLMSGFVISALIPFVETQMQYLNEMVSFRSRENTAWMNASALK